ncbi:hypothetical protein [Mycobacterium antarcticum]|uniref:hypothetical protein n=1 Tax=Mycolicibacterium sp. TUM20984 TaxID=3023368 RepID=UPI0024E0B39A|nr:hypothetical protein [Mycolicibacterium sp. TUM20984]
MNAVADRVTAIRMFTIPANHVGHLAVGAYATIAAQWERLRLLEHQNSALANEVVFIQLSATLQSLSKDLGLRTCTVNDNERNPPGVVGITGRRGFLPNDMGYLRSGTWHESTRVWCHD